MDEDLLIGEGSSFYTDGGPVHDFGAVNLLLYLLLVVVWNVR
jgi:hypothetical protein